jgi:hypothetical protein
MVKATKADGPREFMLLFLIRQVIHFISISGPYRESLIDAAFPRRGLKAESGDPIALDNSIFQFPLVTKLRTLAPAVSTT